MVILCHNWDSQTYSHYIYRDTKYVITRGGITCSGRHGNARKNGIKIHPLSSEMSLSAVPLDLLEHFVFNIISLSYALLFSSLLFICFAILASAVLAAGVVLRKYCLHVCLFTTCSTCTFEKEKKSCKRHCNF